MLLRFIYIYIKYYGQNLAMDSNYLMSLNFKFQITAVAKNIITALTRPKKANQ